MLRQYPGPLVAGVGLVEDHVSRGSGNDLKDWTSFSFLSCVQEKQKINNSRNFHAILSAILVSLSDNPAVVEAGN